MPTEGQIPLGWKKASREQANLIAGVLLKPLKPELKLPIA